MTNLVVENYFCSHRVIQHCVKHFISEINSSLYVNYTRDTFVTGYCNVTAAIDGVDFKMSSGNIDSGVIKMYGITK